MCVLRAELRLIGTFTQGHEFSEICSQFRAKGLDVRCMPRGFLWSPNGGIRRTLEETDHLVHISMQEIEIRIQVGFHRRHSSIGVSAFHDS
jgi:hypothetical protein